METFAMWIRGVFTAALLVLAFWWLARVAHFIPTPVSNGPNGQALDQFQRAKDILLVVLPLLTTALGYWFGSSGREKAEEKAELAQASAANAERRLEGVLDSTTQTGLLEDAKRKFPEAFGLKSGFENN